AVVAMVMVQIGHAGQDILFKLAINDGMNIRSSCGISSHLRHHFHVSRCLHLSRVCMQTVRCYMSTITNKRPEFTWRLFILAFISGLLGAAAPNILLAEGLARTTATFISVAYTLVPLIIFVLAAILTHRMESVQLKSNHGKAKVIETLLGVGGAFLFVLYKGKEIHLWSTHIGLGSRPPHDDTSHNISILGAFLVLGSMISYSLWILFQASFSAKIGEGLGGSYWNIALMSMTGRLGVVISGMAFAITVWCMCSNGPVFVSMFSPVKLVVVAMWCKQYVISYACQHYSIIGTIFIVGVLYLVLWAKMKETESTSDHSKTNMADHNTTDV
ncbi:unnamed protein product, partial [Thlaspi arvense]